MKQTKRPCQVIILPILLFMLALTSCSLDNETQDWEEEERVLIQNYLANHDTINFELKTSGLYYVDIEIGTGLQAEVDDTAYIVYTGKLLDGTEFDSNSGIDTLKYVVSNIYGIAGFNEGLTYMKEGGKALFLVPSSLGFGASGIAYTGYKGTFYIGGYTPMLFHVELVRLGKHK